MYLIVSHQRKDKFILGCCDFPMEVFSFLKKVNVQADKKITISELSSISVGESVSFIDRKSNYGIVRVTKIPSYKDFDIPKINITDI